MAESSKTVSLAGSELPWAASATKVGEPDPELKLTVVLLLRCDPAHDADELAPRLAAAPRRREPVDERAHAKRFSARRTERGRAVAFVRRSGLEVVEGIGGRRSVVARGSARQLEAAFQVELSLYELDGGRYRGYEGAVHLPARLAEAVEAVVGLAETPGKLEGVPTSVKPMYEPDQVAALYRFPATRGRGQRIAVTALGGGFYMADLEVYFKSLGLKIPEITVLGNNDPAPVRTLRKWIKSWNTPNQMPATTQMIWTQEVTMDLELVGALAPEAEIVVCFPEGDTSGPKQLEVEILAMLDRLLEDPESRPTVISNSWNFAEGLLPKSFLDSFNQKLLEAAHLDVTCCFASGDSGSSYGGVVQAQFPAASPYALACGGTTLLAKDGRIEKETAWKQTMGTAVFASGGGVSRHFKPRRWQAPAGVAQKTGVLGRGFPDVAADADMATGIRLYLAGFELSSGGTSAATPLWAALVARLNEKLGYSLGYVTPTLYGEQVSSAFNDVTEGDNHAAAPTNAVLYLAGAGWDPCTGWGSPDGEKLAAALAAADGAPSGRDE
jgi:kumamolisin